MTEYPAFQPAALWPLQSPQDASRLGRLLYRIPFLKFCFDGLFLALIAVLCSLFCTSVWIGVVILMTGFTVSYMTAGYDQRIESTHKRSIMRAFVTFLLAVLPAMLLAGWLGFLAALLAGISMLVSRLSLKASGLLVTDPMRIFLEGAHDIDSYLVKSLATRLGERAVLVEDRSAADIYIAADLSFTDRNAPLVGAYECLTGRAVFASDGPGLDANVHLFLRPQGPVYFFLKRLMDILLAGGAMLVFSPVLLGVWCAIKLESKGPGIFVQEREGLAGGVLKIRKFRSMKVDNSAGAEKRLWTSKNDDRITRVGKIIRKFRVDELPQLWSIVIGEMSIVGPRPQRQFLNDMVPDRLQAEKDIRLGMVPGLTGWAQVNGGYFGNSHDFAEKQSFEIEKLRYDVYYAARRSLLLDLRIILLTFKTVLGQKGH